MVYGVYDIVARVEAETMDKLKATISSKVRKLDKVRSTLRQAKDTRVQCLSFSAGATVQMLNAV
jgi:DNA-binding Lrp family transcriptional regulator